MTLIQIIRRGCSRTGKKRRVNFALFCARRQKNLTADFFYKYKVKEKPQAHYCNNHLWSGLPQWLSGRVCLRCRRHRRGKLNPWVRNIPWKRDWQPTPVFLSGKSQGQRSLMGYSLWGQRESNTTEHACNHTFVVYARHCVRGFIYLHVFFHLIFVQSLESYNYMYHFHHFADEGSDVSER